MKRPICVLLAAALLLGLCACGGNAAPAPSDDGTLQIVTTIFPIYDWTRSILGDVPAELTLLLRSGVDMHSFQPTADDIITISTCDVFIYVGGESDQWVEDALKQAANPDLVAINLLDALGDAAKLETPTEGMETQAEEAPAYDEHVWLSLKNADILCQAIADQLSVCDSAHASLYAANAAAYREQLSAQDSVYAAAIAATPKSALVFGDRFPFRYLADDYGLTCYAAFPGCSAETEASFETIVFLAEKLDELGLRAVMQIEGSDGSIATAIREASATGHQEILTLNSMQSVTQADVDAGVTYLTIMENNLNVLKEALQ